MESEATNPWRSLTTNWTVVHGSLANSLTLESSLSAIAGDEDENDERDLNSPRAKPRPLVLKPDSPDSGPCEITISFKQKHEVQQIYVRSTARVYEIYFESNPHSGKEYLCTVRCGVAVRDEEVVHDNPSKEILRNASSRSSEDEWVEVKVPDNSFPLITQDYYEATAQISDAHPCLSLTLRLLSVQSKDSVCVDEVYVFADPVDSTDSEKEVDQRENSSGNSLMAMLLPSLLQISKAKSATRTEDKHTSEASRKQNFKESGSEAAHPTVQQEGNSSIDDPQKLESQDVNRASVSAAQLQNPVQVSPGESKTDLPPSDRVERALDQLSSRMGRIEDLFLRLEENLLKPINSIEGRLHRVEQQLEVLTSKQKNSELPTCTRFCAPNFSLVPSDSNSFYHSEIDYPRCEEFQSNNKSIHSDVQSNPVNDVSDSVNATHLLPSLVVTAPEFSTCDDEEENHASERVTDSSMDKTMHKLTVDDALASALAGFVSSVSIWAQDHTPTLSVKAPEFPSEEDTEVDKNASPKGQSPIGTDETLSVDGSLSNVSHVSCLDDERNLVRSVDYDQSEKTAEEVDGYYQRSKGEEKELINKNDEQAYHDTERTELFQTTEGTENGEVCTKANNSLVHDKIDIQNNFLLNQIDAIGSDTKEEDATSDSDSVTAAVDISKERSDKVVLRDMYEFSHAASVVDFESSVLDVKFASQNCCDRNCPLEALLSDLPDSKSEETCVEESHDTPPIDEHCDLISVEEGEALSPATDGQIYVDFDYCSLPGPLSTEGETPIASNISSCHETSAVSLI
ncbi:hypothetical protein TorRG33x02_325330 [Trema orientale]|uniref:Uncharacterized protein n=1 Tax=Trema orientale TaxID=63057 RepID=A0A2P5BCW0_TREOI|nr:hypothetical protein TorRG33x02_325330 [Trema orientale]